MSKKSKRRQANQSTAPQHESGDEKSTNRHVYIESGFQVDLVENLKQEYKTANQEATAYNKKQLFWTIVAAGFLLLTALFTYWQARSSERSAEAAKRSADTAGDSLVLVNRPWVGPAQDAFLDITKETPSSGSYLLRIPVKNYGPSPALRVAHHIYPMSFGNKVSIRDAIKEITNACDLAEMTGPKISKWETINKYKPQGSVMFPAQIYTLRENFVWSADRPENDAAFLLVGCVAYSDEFSPKPHHTALCFQSFNSLRDLLPLPKPRVAQAFTICSGFGNWAD